MLNIFRQRQKLVKVVLGVILFLVCGSMVITLIPGITDNLTDSSGNPVVADVGGEKITTTEVQQSLQQVSARNRIPSEMMPFYTNQILNEMILEKASIREASQLGLKVDESELLAQLRQDQNLFPGGSFVGQQQYEDVVSERFGMSVPQFEERYRQALLLDKLRQFVTDTVTVTPAEIYAAFLKDNEKVVLDYVMVYPIDFKKDIGAPNDAVLEAYFKTNTDHYQIPEKRTVKMVMVQREKLRQSTSVPEAELKKYYQDHTDDFRTPERVTVRHILFKADGKDAAKLQEARKKADDLLKKLKAGADFEAMAKQFSEDAGTAVNGGLLSGITRKQTVPEFENAAFSLPPGTLSDPVQTTYGIHIIKVISHDQAHLMSFDEAKATIQTKLLDEKLNAAAADEANQAAVALGSAGADMAAVAAKYHGEVYAPPPFAKDATVPRIGALQPFMEEVFGLQKGQAGAPVQVAEGYAVPVLQDVSPAHQADLAEVKEQVKQDYILDQAKEKAIDKSKELSKALEQQKDKKDLRKAAQSAGLKINTSPAVGPDDTIPSVQKAKDLDAKMFSMAAGAVGGPITSPGGGGGQVFYQIDSVEIPKQEDLAAKKTQIQEQLLAQKRQLVFDVFQDSIKSKLIASGQLKIHQDVLAQITGAGNPKP